MSRTIKQDIKWHEFCKCKCKFNSSVCNNKQRWNNDKCRCECKGLIYVIVCDKSCDVGEYLDYENCKCRKKLVDKLVECGAAEECTATVEEVKLAKINSTENKSKRSYCSLYIVLILIIFLINAGIGGYFLYFHWHLKEIYYSKNN